MPDRERQQLWIVVANLTTHYDESVHRAWAGLSVALAPTLLQPTTAAHTSGGWFPAGRSGCRR